MSKQTKALKQALEALRDYRRSDDDRVSVAMGILQEALADQPAQQQEPVAWMYQCSADSSGPVLMQHKKDWAESGSGLWTETPLYTSPPASKPWVGLSTDEMKEIANRYHLKPPNVPVAFRAIEVKLREKNA